MCDSERCRASDAAVGLSVSVDNGPYGRYAAMPQAPLPGGLHAAALGGAAAVVGQRGHVDDLGDFDACAMDGADG